MVGKIMVLVVVVADIVSPVKPPEPVYTEPAAIVTETAWTEPETAAWTETPTEPQTAPAWQNGFKAYTVNGAFMPYEWQWYLYGELDRYSIAWYFPYALCQIYQESRFNQWAENPNGLDKGLCQFRITYWPAWAAQSGIAGADIFNAYAQLHVFAWLMNQRLIGAGYDVAYALSGYYLGGPGYAAEYVDIVLGFMETMQEVG